jgi:uncharacterized protein
MEPILVGVSELREAVGATTDVSRPVALEPFDVSGVVYTLEVPARLIASMTNSGEGFLLHGSLEATFAVECSKCLDVFGYDIATDVDTLFVDESTEISDEEQDVLPFSGDRIDIAPVLVSSLRVEMPLAPSCSDDCAGICADCGVDLNEDTCDCADKPPADGPFSALKDLLGDDAADE